ncbi:hypothetical protein FB451DRAFT_1167852 [Mycena latifolia]|nr:hypothetical protein FB451DRAFT_1167852 [Mycena latifolia]
MASKRLKTECRHRLSRQLDILVHVEICTGSREMTENPSFNHFVHIVYRKYTGIHRAVPVRYILRGPYTANLGGKSLVSKLAGAGVHPGRARDSSFELDARKRDGLQDKGEARSRTYFQRRGKVDEKRVRNGRGYHIFAQRETRRREVGIHAGYNKPEISKISLSSSQGRLEFVTENDKVMREEQNAKRPILKACHQSNDG